MTRKEEPVGVAGDVDAVGSDDLPGFGLERGDKCVLDIIRRIGSVCILKVIHALISENHPGEVTLGSKSAITMGLPREPSIQRKLKAVVVLLTPPL